MLEYDTAHLRLFGLSQLEWIITTHSGQGGGTRSTLYGSEDHIDIRTPLFVWPDRCIPPGQYNLPFSMKVPDGLPSSFQYDSEDCHVKLVYTVGAAITAGIRSTTDLIVVHQRSGLPIYETSMLRSADIRFWCFRAGRATISAEVSSLAYYFGDTIPLTLKYDFSNCKQSAHNFEVELKFNLSLKIFKDKYEHKSGSLSKAVARCEAKEGTIVFAMTTIEMGYDFCTLLSVSSSSWLVRGSAVVSVQVTCLVRLWS
jgi:hypothetical protein